MRMRRLAVVGATILSGFTGVKCSPLSEAHAQERPTATGQAQAGQEQGQPTSQPQPAQNPNDQFKFERNAKTRETIVVEGTDGKTVEIRDENIMPIKTRIGWDKIRFEVDKPGVYGVWVDGRKVGDIKVVGPDLSTKFLDSRPADCPKEVREPDDRCGLPRHPWKGEPVKEEELAQGNTVLLAHARFQDCVNRWKRNNERRPASSRIPLKYVCIADAEAIVALGFKQDPVGIFMHSIYSLSFINFNTNGTDITSVTIEGGHSRSEIKIYKTSDGITIERRESRWSQNSEKSTFKLSGPIRFLVRPYNDIVDEMVVGGANGQIRIYFYGIGGLVYERYVLSTGL